MLTRASGNPNFVYAVLRNKKRFAGKLRFIAAQSYRLLLIALRSFTLESGREEIERINRQQKEHSNEQSILTPLDSQRGSVDGGRSPSTSHQRSLSDVPEDGTFAIGGDEDDDSDGEPRPTPTESTPSKQASRASSVSSGGDDAVPTQLRGMSEKARGKMPGTSV